MYDKIITRLLTINILASWLSVLVLIVLFHIDILELEWTITSDILSNIVLQYGFTGLFCIMSFSLFMIFAKIKAQKRIVDVITRKNKISKF